MLAFRARYVFPIDTPPLRDGVVAIDHDRIVAIGESSSPAMHDLLPAARDLGDVAILPGFINSHTHLEFSDLQRPLGKPGTPFAQWIREVVHNRRQRSSADDPIARGIDESSACGVTTLGEIASTPWRRDFTWPLEIIEFCEVICFRRDRDQQRYQRAVDAVRQGPGTAPESIHWSDSFRPGISPHTPYSVRPELIQACVQLSAERGVPLALHLAETREELQLLRDGTGPLVDLMRDFEQWDPQEIPRGSRPLDYLKMLAKSRRALIIHGNYLDDDEISFLAAHAEKMSVVYCPRTHAYFQHDPYPLAKMVAAGVNVAIGTDSRASNPDLSVLADMRFAAKQHPRVPPATMLRMITTNAAKALGRDDEIGTLTPGKFADLAIMTLPRRDAVDPHELLFDIDCCITATIFRGGVVHGQLAP